MKIESDGSRLLFVKRISLTVNGELAEAVADVLLRQGGKIKSEIW